MELYKTVKKEAEAEQIIEDVYKRQVRFSGERYAEG